MGLARGFESREEHGTRVPNEHWSKTHSLFAECFRAQKNSVPRFVLPDFFQGSSGRSSMKFHVWTTYTFGAFIIFFDILIFWCFPRFLECFRNQKNSVPRFILPDFFMVLGVVAQWNAIYELLIPEALWHFNFFRNFNFWFFFSIFTIERSENCITVGSRKLKVRFSSGFRLFISYWVPTNRNQKKKFDPAGPAETLCSR